MISPKKLPKLPKLQGMRRKARTAPDAIGSIKKLRQTTTQDERMAYLLRAVGDQSKARQLMELWEEYPAATVPELVAIHWLTKRGIDFVYQLNVRGGRVKAGGIVPDLVVFREPYAIVWLIQGNYWHGNWQRQQDDARAKLLLMGQNIEGRKVSAVVEVWERRLLSNADSVCQAAYLGIEEGP